MAQSRVTVLREFAEGHSFLLAKPESVRYKRPLVFIHGMAVDAKFLARLMVSLTVKLGCPSYAVDIKGHGLHVNEDIRRQTLEDYVADIAHFLRRVVIKKHGATPVLIGHSMGGLLALALTARGDAERTVLITPAPPRGIPFQIVKIPVPTPADVSGYLGLRLFGKPFRVSRKMLEQFFLNPQTDNELITALAQELEVHESFTVVHELRTSSYDVDPRAVKVPVLVVGAGKDTVVNPKIFRKIAKRYGADLIMFPALGHFCPLETGYETVAEHIAAWLSERKVWKPPR